MMAGWGKATKAQNTLDFRRPVDFNSQNLNLKNILEFFFPQRMLNNLEELGLRESYIMPKIA